MPFTFSHPAAILPFHYLFKKRISITGLIAGSLVPDFEYFVRDFHKSAYSHTWLGLVYIDVPAGLLLCFLYHYLICKPLYANAPLFVKRRLAPFQSLNWLQWLRTAWPTILGCLFLGALSHLLWDKLTHQTIPLIKAASGFKKFASYNDQVMTYYLFWDINSLIGAFLVLYSFWLLPTAKNVKAGVHIYYYWLCLMGLAIIGFFIQLAYVEVAIIDNIVIDAINAFLFSIIATSLFFGLRMQRRKIKLVSSVNYRRRLQTPAHKNI